MTYQKAKDFCAGLWDGKGRLLRLNSVLDLRAFSRWLDNRVSTYAWSDYMFRSDFSGIGTTDDTPMSWAHWSQNNPKGGQLCVVFEAFSDIDLHDTYCSNQFLAICQSK